MHWVIQATNVSFTHTKWNYTSMENVGVSQYASDQAIMDKATLSQNRMKAELKRKFCCSALA